MEISLNLRLKAISNINKTLAAKRGNICILFRVERIGAHDYASAQSCI